MAHHQRYSTSLRERIDGHFHLAPEVFYLDNHERHRDLKRYIRLAALLLASVLSWGALIWIVLAIGRAVR